MAALLQKLLGFLYDVIDLVTLLFPDCPFDAVLTSLENGIAGNIMGWLNWFIPFYQMVPIATAWGVAIAVYYMWLVPFRYSKIIE